MKKFTLILFALLATGWLTHAQLSHDNTCTTSFDDISATGTDLFLADDGEANITLPFAFTLDGVSSSNMRVGDNGSILFNATTGQVGTSSTPTAQGFYAYSDDLDSDYGNILWEVLGTAPNRRAVIMWNDRPHYSNSSSGGTFEIILYETSNEITFLYQDTDFGNPTLYDDAISAGIRVVGANGTYIYSTNTALGGVTCINWTIPSCPAVSGVTIDSFNASSAVVSWTPSGSESDWEIAFQASGAGEPAGAGIATTDNPHIQLSLTPDTAYDVYVRADCGGGDLSDWAGPASFTTPPIAPPSCVTTYTPAPDLACGNYDTTLSWDAVIADGYYLVVGTSTGADDVLASTDIGNVTTYDVSSQNAGTTYYYTVSPYNVVGTNTGCAEQTYTTFATGCYCDSMPSSNDGAGISNVRVGLTDYASGDVTYVDHTAGGTEQLGQGLSANLDITFETGYSYSTNVWIDFNDNFTFEASEKVHSGLSGSANPTTYQADFTMPPAADLGVHRMRIVTADNDTLDDACYNGSFGVTLDFNIEVTAVACTPATVDSVTVVDDCGAGTYTVEVDVSDIGSGDGFGTTLFIWGASFDPLVLGINTAGPFPIGGPAENITILDALDNSCSIDLGDFESGSLPPSGLGVSNITGTTADLDWTSNGSETTWEVLILAGGDPAPAGTTSGTDTLTANPYTATGLTAQTSYDAYVRADCGTDLDWVGPVSFSTLCDAITPAYTADMSTNVPDICWDEASNGEVAAGPADLGSSSWDDGNTYAVGSSNAINIYGTTAIRDWLLSPTFDLSVGGPYQLEVNVAVSNWNDGFTADAMGSDDEVQLLSSTDGGTTWVNLTTWNTGNEPTLAGTDYIEDLTAYTGNVQFAIWASNGTTSSTDYDFHVGKFIVRTPPTCFDVSGLTLDSVTDTTANISWTAAGAETNWEIAVQAAGTGVPGTADGSGADTASNNPYAATGLTAQTDYEVYVRAECTAGTEFGAWIGPLNFSTACAVQTAPYTEDFENAGAIPDCWTSSSSNTRVWAYATTPTFGNTYSDNTSGSGYFAFVDASTGTVTTDATLTSPLIDVSGLTNPALDFYVHHYVAGGSASNTITAEVYDGAAWNQVYTDNDGDVNGWENILIDLSSLTITGDIQVRFIMDTSSNSNYENDIAIDDVSIIEGPTCYDPSDIAVTPFATTADISWTAGVTGETNWEVVVQAPLTGEPAAADDSGTNTASNPYSATGLTAETAYEVYVRAECVIGTDFSGWVGPFNFTTTPDCPTVSAITLDSATSTTAELSWTAGNSETNWEIVVQAPLTGEPAAADDSGTNTASNPYSATGLTANTSYEVYVRAECTLTTEFSSWAGPFNFTTPCLAVTTFPWTEDFESITTPAMADCWSTLNENADGDSFITYGTYGVGGSKAAGLYTDFNGGNNDDYLITPPLTLTGNERLKFNVRARSTGEPNDYRVVLSTTGTNAGDFSTELQALTTVSNTTHAEIAPIDLSAYTGTVYIAIHVPSGGLDGYYIYFDNFTVEEIPSCLDPSALVASNVTATSADIGWTAGTETDWEIVVQAPLTGEPAGAGTATTSNPHTWSGLTPETAYEVYVRADCGGAGFSAWTGPFNFTTPCVNTVPDYAADMSAHLPDSCWSQATNGEVAAGPTGLGSSSWKNDAFGADDNQYAYGFSNRINIYGTTAIRDWLISPTFDLSGGGYELVMNVAVTNYNAGFAADAMGADDEVQLLVTTDGGTTWVNLTTWNTGNEPTLAGTEYIADLSAYTGNTQFAIWASNGTASGTDYDFHIGQFEVRTPPTCSAVSAIAVTNITTTSADIDWTAGDSETNWEIAVQAAGTGEPAAADGSGTDTATNSYSATGLTGSSNYEVWVRAECTAGTDFGAWVGPINFDTACDTFSTFPYTEGFESGVPPTCWSSFRGTNDEGTTYDWTTSATANTGSQAAYVRYSVSGNNAEDWLVTPEFDFSALTNPEFSFFTREGLTSDYGSTLTVRVSTTDTAHASFTTVYTSSETDITTYNQLVIDLSTYAGASTVYVAIVWANNDGDSLYVDDVAVYDNIPGTYTYTDGVWSPGTPANDLDDIIVASGNLVVSSDLTCNTMTVNPGASVTVNSGTTLEATNGLSFESSSTSYSSLIRNGSIVGAMTYDRHVNINGSGSTGSNDLVSAPLTGQQFNDFAVANPNILSNAGNTLYLFGPFNKGTGSYVTWADTETATLDPGVGYRAGSTDNGTFTFTGTDNIGDITHDISNSGPNNAEWNLVGNPYPSYLNVQNFLLHDVGGVINLQLFDTPTAAIYGYDGSALNGWTIYNLATTTASTVMAPGQGFFVSADATNAPLYDLEFSPDMRRTGTGDDFIVGRNAALTYLILNVSANSKSYNTDFYFNANATQGLDLGYDANIWGNTAPDFAIYSHLVQDNAGDPVALQALSQTDLNDVTIALGVNANQGEQITFSIADMTIPASVNVYLEDVVANTVTLLNNSDYVFTPTTDLSGTGRFFLRTSEDALSTIDNSLDKLDIFTLKASDELVVSGQIGNNTMLNLYDTQGRVVLSTKLDHTLLQNRINVSSINSGVYIVTVLNNSQEKTKKVIID